VRQHDQSFPRGRRQGGQSDATRKVLGNHQWNFVAYGTDLVLGSSARAQGAYKTLYTFTGGSDGSSPHAGLIFDTAGNLYGTTYVGGAKGQGIVFELTPNPDGSWKESVLYSFCSAMNCTDGANPNAGLIFDQVGNLCSTTMNAGAFSYSIEGGHGCSTDPKRG